MKTEPNTKTIHKKYVMGTYAPNLLITKGKGSYLWDDNNNRYLDFCSGISVCNLGHCHPAITTAIQQQAEKLLHISNLYYNPNQPQLAKTIIKHSFDGTVFFCNSGAEANEGLIKFARRWGNPQGKNQIICMEQSFHGRTLATLAATGRSKYRQGFQPHTTGFTHIPFNNIQAATKAITPETAAILLEPIQGEGGIIPANKQYLQQLRTLCNQKSILLLFDEVQCGMGRTGHYFASQYYNITPDAFSIAKALGNGFPIGAFIIQRKYQGTLPPGTHATTFGGNPLASAAALAVFKTFEQENILQNCQTQSQYILQKLQQLQKQHPIIKQIRSVGLMIGIDLKTPVIPIIQYCQAHNLLVLSAGETVLRLLPPLNITQQEAKQALNTIQKAIEQSQNKQT